MKMKKSGQSHVKPMVIMLLMTSLLFGGILGWKIFTWHMMNRYFATQKTPPVSVSTIKASYQNWQPQIKASGSLRAVQGVDISTEVAGLVRAIHFGSGAQVKAGDLLIELDNTSDLAHLKALEAAAYLAETIHKRNKALFSAHAISKATLEASLADFKNKTALASEQSSIVNKKMIKAPFNGQVGISTLNPGAYINPGDKIVTLQSLDPIYVDFYVPQQMIPKIVINQTISLRTDTYPNENFTGKITGINPKVDPNTRNIQVEAIVPNPENKLFPGMFASVEIITGTPERYLTLPQTAISYNPYGEIVYLIKENNIATQTFITAGETRGNQVAILKGISPNDTVVTAGQLKLKNGSKVIIDNTVVPSNNPTPRPPDE
jgi:membrane fusion protein (multidrug efflux system)